ncbi:CAP domain-containing protein [Maritimibacter sp. DP1N21-5]|uniref:CAP domain-containing protein n=1 Tax=Maritimibacter sp. DP1N21-5 TaxID=2836867 RepID=UPI001C490F7C|nr:CAP domain-containing protein [Maritimibacter sp. DP1N21-5]MBV7409174.1 hypothetical protein [Maritimibacter sp. DP1N21-5]
MTQKTIASVGVALVLSGCMTTSGSQDWRLNSYLPDPAMNTTLQDVPTNDASFETAINGVRAGNKVVQPLRWNGQLDQAAQSYAGYLHATGQFSHTAGNSTVGERVSATGYQWRKVGENLAQGFTDENDVIDAWEGSSEHKKNQNDPDFEDFALGVSGTGRDAVWVLVLADPL